MDRNLKNENFDNINEYTVSGINMRPNSNGIFILTDDSQKGRTVFADEIDFRGRCIMIFDGEGWISECGSDIYPNSDVVTGSPQLSIFIPQGGFCVIFTQGVFEELDVFYKTVMEGAVLYNATMAVGYKAHGVIEKEGKSLVLKYNQPVAEFGKRFLFVGNSATYFNGTPILFKALAKNAGTPVEVDYCTFGSANLSQFADENSERGIALREKLSTGNYDFVVLQDAAGAEYEDVKDRLEVLVPLIESHGAEPLLYMRYGYGETKEKQISEAKRHHRVYFALSERFGIKCDKAADAFPVCFKNSPLINLYADDGNHHSAAAAYLIACGWLLAYLGIDPTDNRFVAAQPPERAFYLQKYAKEAFEAGYEF